MRVNRAIDIYTMEQFIQRVEWHSYKGITTDSSRWYTEHRFDKLRLSTIVTELIEFFFVRFFGMYDKFGKASRSLVHVPISRT